MYYFGYTALAVCLIASIYLFLCYKKQAMRNLTTLLWSLGFLTSAISIAFSVAWAFKEKFPATPKDIILGLGAYLFSGLALVLFFTGAARLITKNLFYKLILPLLLYGIAGFLIGQRVIQIKTIEDIIYFTDVVFVLLLLLPFGLALAIVFLVLYRHLRLTGQPKKSQLGALTVSFAWFLSCFVSPGLFFVPDKWAMNVWFGAFTIVLLHLFVGILFLEKGARESMELHIRKHGLRRK